MTTYRERGSWGRLAHDLGVLRVVCPWLGRWPSVQSPPADIEEFWGCSSHVRLRVLVQGHCSLQSSDPRGSGLKSCFWPSLARDHPDSSVSNSRFAVCSFKARQSLVLQIFLAFLKINVLRTVLDLQKNSEDNRVPLQPTPSPTYY